MSENTEKVNTNETETTMQVQPAFDPFAAIGGFFGGIGDAIAPYVLPVAKGLVIAGLGAAVGVAGYSMMTKSSESTEVENEENDDDSVESDPEDSEETDEE